MSEDHGLTVDEVPRDTFARAARIPAGTEPCDTASPANFAFPTGFEIGFVAKISPGVGAIVAALHDGATVDPTLDEQWDLWRCPGCGKPRDQIEIGHWWRRTAATEAYRCGWPQ